MSSDERRYSGNFVERNTRIFDLNVFDEAAEGATQMFPKPARKAAVERWHELCEHTNPAIIGFFKRIGFGEFSEKAGPAKNTSQFESGKYWQMMDYLDGNIFKRDHSIPANERDSKRAAFQDALLGRLLHEGNARLILQAGWDLAINAALLSDMMPVQRDRGAAYLVENVVWDRGSVMYPSVTNRFAARVVNDAFWQIALNMVSGGKGTNYAVLEGILTRDNGKLSPSIAEDEIRRWTPRNALGVVAGDLVQGDAGRESFYGLSPRAVENYGLFLQTVMLANPSLQVGGRLRRGITPLVRAYKEAVKCRDADGNSYFSAKEQKELLSLDL